MRDEPLDPALREALRGEAYRPALLVTASPLIERIERDRRRQGRMRGASLVGLGAVAAVLISVVVARPFDWAGAPAGGLGNAPCEVSEPTRYESWWVEIGGPNAFFQIEPGTLWPQPEGNVFLIMVRFDPDPSPSAAPEMRAQNRGTGQVVRGVLNGRVDISNVYRFSSPAPSLPGGLYLFEQALPAEGCWTLSAAAGGRVAGTAVVDVRLPWAGTPPPGTGPTPRIAPSATASALPTIGQAPPGLAACPVSEPGPAPDEIRERMFGSAFAVGNDDLWVGGLGPGGVLPADERMVEEDGSIGWKLGWWRYVRGSLEITGRRLDGGAPPLRASVPDGYGSTGFQAAGVYFPTDGCWEVTGRVGEASLTFVVFVVRT